jgi:ubiquinone/menaquinone biosynthesis C-methylase UbiE
MNFYSEISKGYDELYKKEQLAKLNIIKNNVKIISPLLDIGCGTGISTNFFKVESTGIDNNKEMLKLAPKNCSYANAESLPFEDNSFNTIISVTVFQNINNMEKALKEIKRVSSNNNIYITFLKKSSKLKKFRKLINQYFENIKEIEESKDIIFLVPYDS